MRTEELKDILIKKGFREERQDTGWNYTKQVNNIELICYIEPDIEAAFIIMYRWNNNDEKGVFRLSKKELETNKDTIAELFRNSYQNMPRYIGETINLHAEIEDTIESVLG
ncbi:MAG: hypothetical protein E6772_07270 [Dysgonomonas sp.]|nr:hypothetical protein [Dysgonomonas sp.]